MAQAKKIKSTEKYEPGTRGHTLAFGSEDNVYTFDLDESGGVINLEPIDAPEDSETEAETE